MRDIVGFIVWVTIFMIFSFSIVRLGQDYDIAIEKIKAQHRIDTFVQTIYIPVPIESEIIVLAKIIEAESRGECMEGKIAVGNTVLNRIERSYYRKDVKSLEEVILRKNAFCGVHHPFFKEKPGRDAKLAAYLSYVKNMVPDSTYHFLNEKHANQERVAKLNSTKKKIEIENHSFYY